MTAALLVALVLRAAPEANPSAVAYSYRTPDGVVHYVGGSDEIPDAYRQDARRLDLTGSAAEPAEEATEGSAERGFDRRTPETLLAILFCFLLLLLASWGRYSRVRPAILGLAIADLGVGAYVGLRLWSAGLGDVHPLVRTDAEAAGVRHRPSHAGRGKPPRQVPSTNTPAPTPAPAASTAPPPSDPSAPGTPLRKVIVKPAGAAEESDDSEE